MSRAKVAAIMPSEAAGSTPGLAFKSKYGGVEHTAKANLKARVGVPKRLQGSIFGAQKQESRP
jgi:hypothetical protein